MSKEIKNKSQILLESIDKLKENKETDSSEYVTWVHPKTLRSIEQAERGEFSAQLKSKKEIREWLRQFSFK
jgi:hypothetical protein